MRTRRSIKTVEEAYQLASAAAGTVVLDMPVILYREIWGFILCTGFTDGGAVVGQAKARKDLW